jgi:hypothetical protein
MRKLPLAALWLALGLSAAAAQHIDPPATLLDIPPLLTEQDAGGPASPTAIPPSATTETKGSFVQLIASTSNITKSMLIQLLANPNGAICKSYLIDIATGGAGSESVLIANLGAGVAGQYDITMNTWLVPVNIPAGTRLSARSQTDGASCLDNPGIKLSLYTGGFGGNGVDTLGALTATSKGTAVTPGNAANGSWATLVASSAHAYKGLFFALDPQGVSSGDYTFCAMDIGTGGTPTAVLPNILFNDWTGDMYPSGLDYMPISIPAATQISARIQCGGVQTAIGVIAYGVY